MTVHVGGKVVDGGPAPAMTRKLVCLAPADPVISRQIHWAGTGRRWPAFRRMKKSPELASLSPPPRPVPVRREKVCTSGVARMIRSTCFSSRSVSDSAVSTFAGVSSVYVIKDGKITQQNVDLGVRQGDLWEVLNGLKGNETLASNRLNELATGVKVTVDNSAPDSGGRKGSGGRGQGGRGQGGGGRRGGQGQGGGEK